MSYAKELSEAVESLSIPEQVGFLETLDEEVTTALHTGHFTEETMEAAFVAILRESGFDPELGGDEVFEAIDEWLEEELAEGKFLSGLKKHGKAIAKSVGKDIAKQASKPLAKRITKIKTKTKTGKMLKHAAAGAIKQMGKDPGKAKEILKKSAKKAGKKALKSAVKKGMKMVFGKWVKTEAEEMELAEAQRRSSKRAEVERAYAKRGTIRMRPINPQEYPKIRGMEGPFQFRDGRILYYDPREGRYYDRKTDMYLARNDIPEDFQEFADSLMEYETYRDRYGNTWDDEGRGPKTLKGGGVPQGLMDKADKAAKALGGRVKWQTNAAQKYAEGTLKLGRDSVTFYLSPGTFAFGTMKGNRVVKHRELMPMMVKDRDIVEFIKVDLGV